MKTCTNCKALVEVMPVDASFDGEQLLDPVVFRTLTISQAGALFLMHRRNRLAEGTLKGYTEHVENLARFFGDTIIDNIKAVDLHHYQHWRQTKDGSPKRGGAGASLINRECSVLQQILKKAGTWGRIRDWYEPLPLPKESIGRALTEEEASHLLTVASSNSRWLVAYCAATITANTTAGPSEVRKLCLGDCLVSDTPASILIREGVKNKYRIRKIPLNSPALSAVLILMDRAKTLGAELPSHYLLPRRAKSMGLKPDPTRPMSGWKTAWYALRKKAAEKYPHLAKLRHYDLRHHAITSLLENPNVSERTVIDIAGHVGAGVIQKYSHIRQQAKVDALKALERKSA